MYITVRLTTFTNAVAAALLIFPNHILATHTSSGHRKCVLIKQLLVFVKPYIRVQMMIQLGCSD